MNAPVDIELQNVVKQFSTSGGEITRAVDNISLQIFRGEFFALLGPSGCGKTTTLRMIAGFEEPTSGDILLRGRPVQNVPPFHRPVNTVFQDYALFPHMTVLQNVLFGLEMQGMRGRDAREKAVQALERVRLNPNMYGRRPRQLSGGQQQRVALARALVKEPAVLLLDEPLGALDLKLRKDMQFELASMQTDLGITFIYVTHDQEEALTMADRIAVMDRGHVLQVGTPEEIYDTPHTRFVADFIGETNFLHGRVTRAEGIFGWVQLGQDTTVKAAIEDPAIPLDAEITLAVRPEKINLFARDGMVKFPDGSSDHASVYREGLLRDPDINVLEGVVRYVNYIGTDTRYIVEVGDTQQLVARVQNYGLRSDSYFEVGQAVYVFWDAETSRILVQ
jgi:spermidine/putrescine transport system ATP-binding protein